MINIDQNETGDLENMHDFELEKRDHNDLSALVWSWPITICN